MKIRVKLLGQARSAARQDRVEIECENGTNTATLLMQMTEQFGDAFRHVILDNSGRPQASVMLFLNDEQIRPGVTGELREGDELTIMPPISGG